MAAARYQSRAYEAARGAHRLLSDLLTFTEDEPRVLEPHGRTTVRNVQHGQIPGNRLILGGFVAVAVDLDQHLVGPVLSEDLVEPDRRRADGRLRAVVAGRGWCRVGRRRRGAGGRRRAHGPIGPIGVRDELLEWITSAEHVEGRLDRLDLG